uniref:Uncharacterized protein n=1 Tax=Globodera rostochiensis TaxID=31243 RepID=A0A914HBP9_GLORO
MIPLRLANPCLPKVRNETPGRRRLTRAEVTKAGVRYGGLSRSNGRLVSPAGGAVHTCPDRRTRPLIRHGVVLLWLSLTADFGHNLVTTRSCPGRDQVMNSAVLRRYASVIGLWQHTGVCRHRSSTEITGSRRCGCQRCSARGCMGMDGAGGEESCNSTMMHRC